MAKQTFTTGQVLTAAQMTSLQQTAMLGGNATAKTTSYTLVAADAGTTVAMSNAGATTITVNTSLFAAGDIVTIYNQGAGVCTITAGTATVNTSGSLVLAQYQGGVLYFISASAAVFFQFATPASGDIEGVTAGVGISGGGTSGTVTITNSMATEITTSGDLIQGTGSGTFARLGIGTNGQVLSSNGTSATWTTQSAGTTFTQKYTPTTTFTPYTMATNGTTIIVAAGSNGNLVSSTDSGATFTARTSGFGGNGIYGMTFGNGIFVAVGQNGTITTSTDGITWTARTAGVSTNSLYSVSYLNSTFIAVGSGAAGGTGGVTTSTDGITWTKRTTPGTTSAVLYSVTYGNGYYVAVGDFNTTAGIYSTNLSTWTGIPTTINTSVAYVDYQNSQFIVLIPNSQTMWYTGNNPTTGWASITNTAPFLSAPQGDLGQVIKPYNSRYYYISTDVNMIPQIHSISTAFSTATAVGFTTDYAPIPIPTRFWTSGVQFTTPQAFTFQTNGKILFIQSRGRIFLQD